jgi:hypothetical protein
LNTTVCGSGVSIRDRPPVLSLYGPWYAGLPSASQVSSRHRKYPAGPPEMTSVAHIRSKPYLMSVLVMAAPEENFSPGRSLYVHTVLSALDSPSPVARSGTNSPAFIVRAGSPYPGEATRVRVISRCMFQQKPL